MSRVGTVVGMIITVLALTWTVPLFDYDDIVIAKTTLIGAFIVIVAPYDNAVKKDLKNKKRKGCLG